MYNPFKIYIIYQFKKAFDIIIKRVSCDGTTLQDVISYPRCKYVRFSCAILIKYNFITISWQTRKKWDIIKLHGSGKLYDYTTKIVIK